MKTDEEFWNAYDFTRLTGGAVGDTGIVELQKIPYSQLTATQRGILAGLKKFIEDHPS